MPNDLSDQNDANDRVTSRLKPAFRVLSVRVATGKRDCGPVLAQNLHIFLSVFYWALCFIFVLENTAVEAHGTLPVAKGRNFLPS